MGIAWRFFTDTDTRWRWERISTTQETVHSPEAYASYEDCVAAASAHGYKFAPSQERKRLSPPPIRPDRMPLQLPRR